MTFGRFKSFVMGLQNMAVFPENGMKPARERGRERDKEEINAKSSKWESRITTESELSASVNPGFPKNWTESAAEMKPQSSKINLRS